MARTGLSKMVKAGLSKMAKVGLALMVQQVELVANYRVVNRGGVLQSLPPPSLPVSLPVRYPKTGHLY